MDCVPTEGRLHCPTSQYRTGLSGSSIQRFHLISLSGLEEREGVEPSRHFTLSRIFQYLYPAYSDSGCFTQHLSISRRIGESNSPYCIDSAVDDPVSLCALLFIRSMTSINLSDSLERPRQRTLPSTLMLLNINAWCCRWDSNPHIQD